MKGSWHQLERMRWLFTGLVTVSCFVGASAMISKQNTTLDIRPPLQSGGSQRVQDSPAEPPYVPKGPVSCGAFATLVDTALVEWQEMQGTYFIVIARLGAGEMATEINKSRLKDVEDYLKRDKTIRYVTAEGNRVNGPGQVEFYVGGKLRTVIPVKKNERNVCSGKVNPFL